MNEEDKLAASRACERLIALYTHLVDFGKAESIAELFVDTGIWESGRTRLVGRDQLRSAFLKRQRTKRRRSRHVCTNVVIDVLNENEADGVTYLTLYRYEGPISVRWAPLGGPAIVGEYYDHFVRTEEGWRFSYRRVKATFLRRPRGVKGKTESGRSSSLGDP